MKRFVVFLGVVAALLMVAVPASSAPVEKLRAFGTGDVTLVGDDGATIVNDAGEYGGVYVPGKAQSGELLADVTYSFTNAGGDVAGGAPRLSIPIDDPSTGPTLDAYAFIDVANCGGLTGGTTLVSTESVTCPVFYGDASYANWAAFAAAEPTFRIARGRDAFVIADQPGSYAVSNVVLT